MDYLFVPYTPNDARRPFSVGAASDESTSVVPSSATQEPRKRRFRNTSPCEACKLAKRRCDLATPKCARCSRQNLDCRVPKVRWKSNQIRSSRALITPDSGPHYGYDREGVAEESTGLIVPSSPEYWTTSFQEQPLPHVYDPESTQWHHAAFNRLPNRPNEGPENISDSLFEIFQLPPSLDSLSWLPVATTEVQSHPTRSSTLPSSTSWEGGQEDRRQLWNIYTSQLVNTITAHNSDFGNPLVDYLLPRALERPSFRSAILYLAFVMKARQVHVGSSQDTQSTDLQQNRITDTRFGSHLEKEALSDSILFENSEEMNPSPSYTPRLGNTLGLSADPITSLNTLATLLILCKAYITSSNTRSLLICLEQAFILAKKHWGQLFSNQEFTFLIRCLGYMHTTAMLSPGNYRLNAPDFLSLISNGKSVTARGQLADDISLMPKADSNAAQAEAETRSQCLEASAIKKLHQMFRSACFADIDPTTGISNAVAALLYNIGRLSRLKSTALDIGEESYWFWGAFESDLDGLDLQLQQTLQSRNDQTRIFEASLQRLNLLDDKHKVSDMQQTIHLTRYNDALVHCGRIIFLERIACVNDSFKEISASVQRILSLCASIPDSSHTAKLLVLPLYVAGSWASTLEMQSFIRSRLVYLTNSDIVADTRMLLRKLEARWEHVLVNESDNLNTMPEEKGICMLY